MALKVFLIEDSPLIRESICATIEELASAQVVGFAEDAPAASEWIAAHGDEVDLLVIDIFLKRGSGLDVLRSASTLKARKVVLSNYATPEMRRRCLEVGADRVFDKSNEIEALIAYCARLDGETGPEKLQ
jgi:DNA-binding NarL/FixJ family response regulator